MRLRFLLRPEWLALTLVVVVFAVTCFAVLAPWQFGRHAERKATNDAITRSFTAAPVPLADLAEGTGEWRTVTLTGTYLADDEVVARLRTVQGEAAFEVLTPFRLTDGTVALVDRGYVRPVQGREELTLPSYPEPPAGTRELTARVRADERDPQGRSPLGGERPQVYAVDSRAVGEVTGLSIRPGYVQLAAGSPGVLGPLPLPELEAGPFLSYALQWITFGVMALLAWLYFTWREIRPGGVLAERAGEPAQPGPGSAPTDQARPRGPHGQRGQRRRRTVAQQIAEDEARERAASNQP
ncbi:SURF1 family cytochrome oxidase biogenesis protein [Actinophytocola sp.]|uniref:SURF1 family cytochrome oxidase biogenesis protein n=1 Tax=Actinophytocola sp. TaxID=1872138 RepID=UPI003D6C063A